VGGAAVGVGVREAVLVGGSVDEREGRGVGKLGSVGDPAFGAGLPVTVD
jgi:hypothetical protein